MPFPTQLDRTMQDDHLARLRAQAARANAAMADIVAELRADGLLKPIRERAERSEIQKDHDEEREGGWAV